MNDPLLTNSALSPAQSAPIGPAAPNHSPNLTTIVGALVARATDGSIDRIVGFVLEFSGPIDPIRAGVISSFNVTEVVPELSDTEGLPVMLSSLVYNPASQSIFLILARSQNFAAGGQIVVNTSPPDGITDLTGTYIDGSGNGMPGSPAVLHILPGATAIVTRE